MALYRIICENPPTDHQHNMEFSENFMVPDGEKKVEKLKVCGVASPHLILIGRENNFKSKLNLVLQTGGLLDGVGKSRGGGLNLQATCSLFIT